MDSFISEKEKSLWANIVARPVVQAIVLALCFILFYIIYKLLQICFLLTSHAIVHGFDTDGLDAVSAKRKLRTTWTIIGMIFFFLLLYIHSIPAVNDYFWLSSKHTINISSSSAITLPDRSYFTVKANAEILQAQSGDGRLYRTYKEGPEQTFERLENGVCQLVPHEREILLSSLSPPSEAVGFTDEVVYLARFNLLEMPSYRYYLERIAHPSYLWKSREELSKIQVLMIRKAEWKVFLIEWNSIELVNSRRMYSIEALWNENAMICL